MSTRLKEVSELEEGQLVKWDHLIWHKILEIKVSGGWAYLRFEGVPRQFTIRADIELPWRNH